MEEQKNEQKNEQPNVQQPNGLKSSGGFIWIIIIVVFLIIIGMASKSSDDYTAEDLLDAQVKQATGQEISREDEIMLDGYDDWKADEDKYED